MIDRLRVTIVPKGSLTGIVIPSIEPIPGFGPFYVYLTQSEMEKGWEAGLLSCIAYYEASAREIQMVDDKHCQNLKTAISYLYELYAHAIFYQKTA